ncbi:MAG: exo-alpha-sialidase, partial [Chloroflexi bacterium]|nr:exo-alpha-sialidase [Chloroflexota bacterium]
DARMAVYRTRNQGETWEKLTRGLPQKNAYLNVLREGMAVDALRPAGLYLGTNTGQLYFSADEGDSWRQAAPLFPPVNSVGTATL